MVQFIDTDGNTFIALADISFVRSLNGEKSISGTIYTNNDVLHRIDRGWQVEFENEKYYLTYAMPTDYGNNITVEFDAIHEFFFRMGKSCVYDTLNGSNTAKAYLDFIFKNSGFTYSLAATIPAFEKENFGMKNRLALFNDFINSTNTEFQIIGNNLYIVDKIGSDLSTIVRKGFNMQELGLEHNISDFVTYAKGFGAYKDPNDVTKGRLIVEYTSPLAEIYGKLETDPIVDERYTKEDSFLEHLKEIVESSYSISVNLTVEDLRKVGYQYGLPEPGDYIMAVNEQLGFQQKIRIVGVTENFNVTGDLIENNITCNSLNLVDKKNQADASNAQSWSDISNGIKPIPNEWLTAAIQQATSDLINSQTEVKYAKTGILAIDKNDSNKIVILNSAGIGISTDGGKSFENAITANGINASAINTGILKAIAIEGVTISGSVITSIGKDFSLKEDNGAITWTRNSDGKEIFKFYTTLINQKEGNVRLDVSDEGSFTIFNKKLNKAFLTFFGATNNMSGSANLDNFYVIGSGHSLNFAPGSFGYSSTASNSPVLNVSSNGFSIGNNSTKVLGSSGGRLSISATSTSVTGNLSVTGSKNSLVDTLSYGHRLLNAYETPEYYFADYGKAITDSDGEVKIDIDPIFLETVNTESENYHVMLSPYSKGIIWVEETKEKYFIVKSDPALLEFSWNLIAYRKGYEDVRLTQQEEEDYKK
ncbi:phage tail protein [Enterococcus faecalis]|uniref:phage tail protein n=1 Tax=Enterococcus faecalis TaxID=1351 RepID=UPI001BDFB8CE|nr:phage tail protein [Enterococcus faecalis]MBT2156259.1 phage tail protein [Enterococcus faecalis]MCD4917738.1 phage tail protein [Enterococcus faecalis]